GLLELTQQLAVDLDDARSTRQLFVGAPSFGSGCHGVSCRKARHGRPRDPRTAGGGRNGSEDGRENDPAACAASRPVGGHARRRPRALWRAQNLPVARLSSSSAYRVARVRRTCSLDRPPVPCPPSRAVAPIG